MAMANYIIRASNHQEWLKAREGGIGASEIGTLLGVNPYDTPYQLWLRKTGRVPAQENENFLMKAGHYLEDAIAHFCADETGVSIIKRSADEFVVVNKDKEYLRVSPDRYAWLPNATHNNGNKVIIECKSTQKPIDADNIPMTWFCQVMYQLGVCELNDAYIAWLTQGRDFGCKHLSFDKDFYNDVIVAEIERFWKDNIIGGKEPALVNIDDVMLKFPKQITGKSVSATDDILDKYNTLVETNAEIKRLTAIKSDAESAIKLAMEDAESLVDGTARTLVTWKAAKDSTKFNEKEFSAKYPQMYQEFLVTSAGSRRFVVK